MLFRSSKSQKINSIIDTTFKAQNEKVVVQKIDLKNQDESIAFKKPENKNDNPVKN